MKYDLIIHQAVQTIVKEAKETMYKALVLRIRVHMHLAKLNGAEDEDMPEVIAQAIASASEQLLSVLEDVSETKKASILENEYGKGKK